MSVQTQNNYNLCYTARATLSGFFFFRGGRGYRLCGALSVLSALLSVGLSLPPLSPSLPAPRPLSPSPPSSLPPPQALSLSVWSPSLPPSVLLSPPPPPGSVSFSVSPPSSPPSLSLSLPSPLPPLINTEAVWVLTVHVNSAAAYAGTNLEAAVVV